MIGPRTLFGKLLLLLLGFGALMTGVFLFVMRVSHQTYHLEFDQIVNRDLAQQYVRANLLVREPPLTAHNFAESLKRIVAINPGIDVYVLDARGEILASSGDDRRAVSRRVALEPLARFLDGRTGLPLLGDNPADPAHRQVFSVAPLSIPNCPAAYLYVVLNQHHEGSAASKLRTTYAIGEGAGFILVATVLAVLGSVLYLRVVTRRLTVLQHDIDRFGGSGDDIGPARNAINDRVTEDEIERLRRSFVKLAGRISDQMQELQSIDAMRRELLTSISHDLRTPLTTLQAHLEMLSARDDLSDEERRSYLGVGMRQCRRLIRLVEQLLELARLDAGQVTISPESFHLAELVQDVVMKYALSARRAGVALGMEAPTDLPLVTGDVGLTERVLDNLVDNAFRYAGEGGRVTLRLERAAQTVRVSVHDTGPGIPESERSRVFDRFYRGDKSRSGSSGHAGLGLSIARGILELHGGSIDCVSSPQQGTTFFFELPIAESDGAVPASGPQAQRRETAAG